MPTHGLVVALASFGETGGDRVTQQPERRDALLKLRAMTLGDSPLLHGRRERLADAISARSLYLAGQSSDFAFKLPKLVVAICHGLLKPRATRSLSLDFVLVWRGMSSRGQSRGSGLVRRLGVCNLAYQRRFACLSLAVGAKHDVLGNSNSQHLKLGFGSAPRLKCAFQRFMVFVLRFPKAFAPRLGGRSVLSEDRSAFLDLGVRRQATIVGFGHGRGDSGFCFGERILELGDCRLEIVGHVEGFQPRERALAVCFEVAAFGQKRMRLGNRINAGALEEGASLFVVFGPLLLSRLRRGGDSDNGKIRDGNLGGRDNRCTVGTFGAYGNGP